MKKKITLSGKLKFFYLSNVLQLISSNHKTGTLYLKHKNKNTSIIFEKGTIIFATGNRTELKLGFILKNKDLLSNEQLKHYLKLSKKRKISLGKLLVEESIISSNELNNVVKQQIEEILYKLFFWKGGSFYYDENPVNLSKIIVSPLDLFSLLMEASRRVDEMTVLREHIPNNNIVFELTEKTKNKNAEFIANEWTILNLIDGINSIQKIINKSNLDKYSVYKMLYALLSSGFIAKKV